MADKTVSVNRAPVLTLWAAVVAERLGYDSDTALTLGRAVAGLSAQSKGRMLGIFGPPKSAEDGGPPKKVGLGEDSWVDLLGRGVPVKTTENGVRAVVKDQAIKPETVSKYLAQKFGEDMTRIRQSMERLAGSYEPTELAEAAYGLYEKFRPKIPAGTAGWGAKGILDLGLIEAMARRKR